MIFTNKTIDAFENDILNYRHRDKECKNWGAQILKKGGFPICKI